MGLWDRLRGGATTRSGGNRRGTLDRASGATDLAHLEQFVATRQGVEGYVEPRTAVSETTIVLVAADGEWTRRRIAGPQVARRLRSPRGLLEAVKLVDDVVLVGALGMGRGEVRALREAHAELAARRVARGKSARP